MTPKRKTSWLALEWFGTTVLGLLPDSPAVTKAVAKLFYAAFNGWRAPDLREPTTFNERMILLKLAPDAGSDLRKRMTDKEHAKGVIEERVGPGHVVPTLAVIRSPDEIDDFVFPAPCVVKPTHSSQEVMAFETEQPTPEERRRLKYWMRKSYFAANREPNYRGLQHKLIVEPVIGGAFGAVDDVKVMCFFGEPRLIQIDRGRFQGRHRRDFYDVEGRYLPVAIKYPTAQAPFDYDVELPEILRLSRALSGGFPYLRVDLYVADGCVFVGELTSFPSNCVQAFHPPEADRIIARALDKPGFLISPRLFDGLPPPTLKAH